MLDRLPPQSNDAEQAVLGSILIDQDAIKEVVDFLKVDNFYRPGHRAIFEAMVSLFNKKEPIDVVTVYEALDRAGELDNAGGASYLSQLSGDTPTAIHIGQYGRIVERKAAMRRLIGAAGKIAEIGYEDGEDVEQAFDKAEATLQRAEQGLVRSGKDPAPSDIISRVEGTTIAGIPTRFPILNMVTAGMVPGEIWIVGGFTSVGKSAVTCNLMDDVVKARGVGMIASTEMGQEAYMRRMLSLTSGIPQRTIRHGGMTLEQGAAFTLAKDYWRGAKVRIFDDLYSTTRIRNQALKVRDQFGRLDVLFVDFIQNLGDTGDEVKDARIAAIGLQALAKEANCCVIALSQISNAEAMRQGESGSSSNYYAFKGSGAIAHAADLAVMLDRDRQNKPDVMWFNVLKNRNDMPIRFATRFGLETGSLAQMSEEEQADADPNAGRKSRKADVPD